MKYISKNIKNEPNALREYRSKTPNANYKGYVDYDTQTEERSPLKKALLKEQGYLCAYCMKRINLDLNKYKKPNIEIEHYESQSLFPKKDLAYKNMLGVCNGQSPLYPEKTEVHHCDKTPGKEGKMSGDVKLKKLDPRNRSCEQLIEYTLDGEIKSINDDSDVEYDIKALNLNNEYLIRARKVKIDAARERMIRTKQTQQWDKAFLRNQRLFWLTPEDGEFKTYCMVAVDFLNKLMKKNKYK